MLSASEDNCNYLRYEVNGFRYSTTHEPYTRPNENAASKAASAFLVRGLGGQHSPARGVRTEDVLREFRLGHRRARSDVIFSQRTNPVNAARETAYQQVDICARVGRCWCRACGLVPYSAHNE